MGITARIVLGLGAGAVASMLVPGWRSQGLITYAIGVAGGLLGGWVGTGLFRVVPTHGFVSPCSLLTAIAGGAILLLACHLVITRGRGRRCAQQ